MPCANPTGRRVYEDVGQKLDYVPEAFTVKRRVRSEGGMRQVADAYPGSSAAQAIEGGTPTAALLAQETVAKYADNSSLYRQKTSFGVPTWLSRARCEVSALGLRAVGSCELLGDAQFEACLGEQRRSKRHTVVRQHSLDGYPQAGKVAYCGRQERLGTDLGLIG